RAARDTLRRADQSRAAVARPCQHDDDSNLSSGGGQRRAGDRRPDVASLRTASLLPKRVGYSMPAGPRFRWVNIPLAQLTAWPPNFVSSTPTTSLTVTALR